jgi:hypothetical protein
MKKLSKEKRSQVILTSVMTLLVIGGLWSFLIRYQQRGLQELSAKITASETKLQRVTEIIKNSRQIETELNVESNKLAAQEASMASGDLYSSMVSSIRSFKQNYNIDIPQFNSGGAEAPVDIMPRFPFKQVTLNIGGTAFYNDLGKFISDYENQFPSSRILNLDISRASAQSPDEREKLAFKMDIVSLVKSPAAPSSPAKSK